MVLSSYLIFFAAPRYGRKTVLIYITICSLVGSLTVMMCKGFGIALRLTFAGNNQLIYPSTYFFAIVSLSCILIQLNYFNKALDAFSTALVTPIYYVFFTTATIIASVALFQGFDGSDPHQVVSALCGFLIIFLGVYLLCIPNESPKNSSKYLQQLRLDDIEDPTREELLVHKNVPVFDVDIKATRIDP